MEILIGIAVVIGLFALVSLFMESKVTGLYKTFGVYGRLKAYLFIDFLMVGIAAIGLTIYSSVSDAIDLKALGFPSPAISIVLGVVMIALAFVLYLTSAAKCPEMLKKKLFISMVITGLAIALKIGVFFFGFVWKLTGPQEVVSSDGRTLYRVGSSVYTADGTKVGDMTGADTFMPNENY